MKTTSPRPSRVPRLHQWYAKFAYVLVAIAVYYFGGALGTTDNLRGILRSALVFVLVLLATRFFRGATEPGDGPRPWWRMTGRPLAGFVLGGVFAIAVIGLVAYAYGVETEKVVHESVAQEPVVIASAILFAALAVLYLTSSVRLRGVERQARLDADRVPASSDSSSVPKG